MLVKASWVFCALAISLAAQQPPVTDPAALLRADAQQRADWAAEWLRSEEPLKVAWGAWLARQDNQTVLIPPLIEKVNEYQLTGGYSSQTERDRHDALLVVLDALIGLHATVPVEDARKLYPEFAAQAIILLVRSPDDAQSALLEIFQQARANYTWLAAGNVLMKARTPGFAALLLIRFTQHMTVSVYDPFRGGGVGGGGGECGFPNGGPKANWPAVGLYQLTQLPDRMSASATFLVGGDTTIYYWRIEPGNYDNPPDVAGFCDDGNRDVYRAQYLNKLMERSFPRISLDPYPQLTLTWNGDRHYSEQLITAVDEHRARFRRTVAWLLESGQVLTPAEAAALKPRLEIMIRDERADRSVPLPAILEKDRTVAVRTALTTPLE